MSDTPSKIDKALMTSEESLNSLVKEYDTLYNSIQSIRSLEDSLMSSFDSVPVERLRGIKPLIEEYLASIDQLNNLFEITRDIDLDEISSRLRKVKKYFDDNYMTSVAMRKKRDKYQNGR